MSESSRSTSGGIPRSICATRRLQRWYVCMYRTGGCTRPRTLLRTLLLTLPRTLLLLARSFTSQLLRNRKSMLDVVPRDGFAFPSEGYQCAVPNHVVLEEGISFTKAQVRIDDAGLTFPFLAKSLWADGRAGSHDIAVVWSVEGLERLCQCEGRHGLPALLEQYVDHGECMFKVYVLGNQQVICTRPSLHLDLDCREPCPREPMQIVNRVSAYPSSQTWGNAFLAPEKHGVPTPPEGVWRGVAHKLQELTGLSLFNFDLIVPRNATDGRLVMLIDVNYYPGIEKLPDSSGVLIGFIESLMC